MGHPGAIEIAASLWKGWPLKDILRGLRDRAMEVLEDPHRTDVNRSMQLSVGLSYDLLQAENADAWELFPKLSVFQASFSHEAAHAIAGGSEVLPALEFLVDRSLVRFNGRRHFIHTAVREFGLERLGEARSEYELEVACYILEYATEYSTSFDRLDEEKGNLFAVMQWAEARQEYHEMALSLTGHLSSFMLRRGLWTEMAQRLQRALEIAELIGDEHRIIFHRYYLGNVLGNLGDEQRSRKLIDDGLSLAREGGYSGFVGLGLLHQAREEMNAGNLNRARELGHESLPYLKRSGVGPQICMALSVIGMCEEALGNLPEANSCFEKSLAAARKHGHARHEGRSLKSLFDLDIRTSDFVSAEERFQEYEELAVQTGDPRQKGIALIMRAALYTETSELDLAADCLRTAITHLRRERMHVQAIEAREGLVRVATEQGNPSMAKVQLRTIAAEFKDFGNPKGTAFALYRLGLVQEDVDTPEEAKLSYETALALYRSVGQTDDPIAQEAARRIRRLREGVASPEG